MDDVKLASRDCPVRAERDEGYVDAHVILVARRERAAVVTNDPDDLARLDAHVELVVC